VWSHSTRLKYLLLPVDKIKVTLLPAGMSPRDLHLSSLFVTIVPVLSKKKFLYIVVPCQYYFVARLSMDAMDGSGM
jgi:hypothetical protein